MRHQLSEKLIAIKNLTQNLSPDPRKRKINKQDQETSALSSSLI